MSTDDDDDDVYRWSYVLTDRWDFNKVGWAEHLIKLNLSFSDPSDLRQRLRIIPNGQSRMSPTGNEWGASIFHIIYGDSVNKA